MSNEPLGTPTLVLSLAMEVTQQCRPLGHGCTLQRDCEILVNRLASLQKTAADNLAGLTAREHQILGMVVNGDLSKNIAADLGISRRTVENHRASIMQKAGSKSIPDLVRMALFASWGDATYQNN